jgi:DNA helicase-2/ATP-dependent DNA helicase PcrA
MEEGLLPHHRSVAAEGAAIDEERRLCYVGITRAQDRLTMSLALTRMKWGKPRPTQPSRFLFEVTGDAEKAQAAASRRLDRQPSGRPTKKKSGSAKGPRAKKS